MKLIANKDDMFLKNLAKSIGHQEDIEIEWEIRFNKSEIESLKRTHKILESAYSLLKQKYDDDFLQYNDIARALIHLENCMHYAGYK